MAFIANDFSPVGAQSRRGVGMQTFSYTTPDVLSVVKTSGYFNSIAKLLDPNDAILYTATNGGTEERGIIFVDAISAADVVTIATEDINAAT